MRHHLLEGRVGVAKVPNLQNWGLIIVGCDHDLRRDVRVPPESRAALFARRVCKRNDRALLLEVPDDGGAV